MWLRWCLSVLVQRLISQVWKGGCFDFSSEILKLSFKKFLILDRAALEVG